MVYFTYIINLITGIMTDIVIPIPFSEDKIYYLSIFSIIMGILVLSIIVYFITKLLGIETSIFWSNVYSDLSKAKNDIKGTEITTIKKAGVNSDGTNNYAVNKVRRYTRKL